MNQRDNERHDPAGVGADRTLHYVTLAAVVIIVVAVIAVVR